MQGWEPCETQAPRPRYQVPWAYSRELGAAQGKDPQTLWINFLGDTLGNSCSHTAQWNVCGLRLFHKGRKKLGEKEHLSALKVYVCVVGVGAGGRRILFNGPKYTTQ